MINIIKQEILEKIMTFLDENSTFLDSANDEINTTWI